MSDEKKIREQLIQELRELRQRKPELEAAEAGRKWTEEVLRIQRDLAIALSLTADLKESLRLCTEAAIHVSGLDCGGVYLVDPTSGALNLAFHTGLPADFVKGASHYDADSANARLVMKGQPVYTRHPERVVPSDEAVRCEHLRFLAVVPVEYEGEVIACLNITSHTLEDLPVHARQVLETISAQMGYGIAHAEAEEALRREAALDRVRAKVLAMQRSEEAVQWIEPLERELRNRP